MNDITCTVKEAKKLMEHLDDDSMVILTVVDIKTYIHYGKPKRIKRKTGDRLLEKAESITYQDNDYFGRFSLYGTTREKDIIQNILFSQLE